MTLKRSHLKSQVQLPKHGAQGICLTALNKVLWDLWTKTILYVNLVKLSIGNFLPHIGGISYFCILFFEPNKLIAGVHVRTGRLSVGGRSPTQEKSMTALICIGELRHSLGSFIKIGSTSGCSAVLLASLLPLLLHQTRVVAASSSVNCCEGFSSKTFLVPQWGVLQRARGFSLLISVREESTL